MIQAWHNASVLNWCWIQFTVQHFCPVIFQHIADFHADSLGLIPGSQTGEMQAFLLLSKAAPPYPHRSTVTTCSFWSRQPPKSWQLQHCCRHPYAEPQYPTGKNSQSHLFADLLFTALSYTASTAFVAARIYVRNSLCSAAATVLIVPALVLS